MSKHRIGRRSMLQFAGSFSMVTLAAKAARAKDRSVSSVDTIENLPGNSPDLVEYSCNNAGVPISEKATRVSLLEDFNDYSSCEMTPRSFEGPYFYCGETPGKNIAVGQVGEPLILALRVVESKNCTPITGAIVDVWHADAKGVYSGYDADPDMPASQAAHLDPTNSDRWCRGALVVDEDGIAEFETVYPSYYLGRAIHIHYKIHLGNQSYVTNQTLLPETYNQSITSRPPYNIGRQSKRRLNSSEAKSGFDTLNIVKRDDRLVGTLTVVVE